MKNLIQSIKCLFGYHRWLMRRKVSRYSQVDFICEGCGKKLGGK